MKLTFLFGTATVIGSPGMEQGGRIDPYTVLLLQRDAGTLPVSLRVSVRCRTDGGCMSAQFHFNGTDPDVFGSGSLFGAELPTATAGKQPVKFGSLARIRHVAGRPFSLMLMRHLPNGCARKNGYALENS